MARQHVNPKPPRPDRPSTTRLEEAASHVKETTTLVRKRGATDDLSNPLKKISKTRKHDSSPGPEFMDDPPYDQVEGTVHRLTKGWNQLKAENQKLEQKNLLRKSREAELREQVRKLTLMQRAAKNNDDARSYNVTLLDDKARLQALHNCNTNEEIPHFPRTTRHIDKMDDVKKVHGLLKEIVRDYFPQRGLSLLVLKDVLRAAVGRMERDAFLRIQHYEVDIDEVGFVREVGMDYLERVGVHGRRG